MATLYVHLDESGNLGFNVKATRHYVFAVAWTYDPASLAAELTEIRFALLKNGHNISVFHAAEEKQIYRHFSQRESFNPGWGGERVAFQSIARCKGVAWLKHPIPCAGV